MIFLFMVFTFSPNILSYNMPNSLPTRNEESSFLCPQYWSYIDVTLKINTARYKMTQLVPFVAGSSRQVDPGLTTVWVLLTETHLHNSTSSSIYSSTLYVLQFSSALHMFTEISTDTSFSVCSEKKEPGSSVNIVTRLQAGRPGFYSPQGQ